MTNGEKLKEIFPYLESDKTDLVKVLNIDNLKNWWNAEYKESTPKNDLGVDAISRSETIDYLCKHCPDDGECFNDCDEIKHLRQMPSVTPQAPCEDCHTKMDEVRRAYDNAMKQEPILDKIRAEIEKEIIPRNSDQYDHETMWQNMGLRMALKTIDKYKEEVEPQKRSDKE